VERVEQLESQVAAMRRDIDGMDEEVRSLREAVRKLERELDEMRDEVRPLLPKPKPIPRLG
jgi:uncharacterized coiled-coil DUF342 family protein